MPIHRALTPPGHPAARRAPRLAPGAATTAIVGLAVAVSLAALAALIPFARLPLLALAALIAVPSVVVGLRLTRAMPGGDRDLRTLGASDGPGALTDPLTGAGNAAAFDAAVEAAVLDPAAVPLTVVRLALATSPAFTPRPALAAPDPATAATSMPSGASHHPDADDEARRHLVLAGVRWLEILRPGDLLARADGGEFGVVLPRCNARAARAVIGRLQTVVPDGAVLAVGVATWDGEESASALRGRADDALDAERQTLTHDPIADPARVAAATATGLTGRGPLAEFDEIASGVAWLLRTPVVVITLFDESWQHFIGQRGVDTAGGPVQGVPAREAICRQTVATGRPLVVSDTSRHPTLREIPATRDLGVRACASVPITSAEGHVIGSVCAMVLERHTWSVEDVALLKLTAARVSERLTEAPAPALSAA